MELFLLRKNLILFKNFFFMYVNTLNTIFMYVNTLNTVFMYVNTLNTVFMYMNTYNIFWCTLILIFKIQFLKYNFYVYEYSFFFLIIIWLTIHYIKNKLILLMF